MTRVMLSSPPPRLVPIGIRPIAALLVTAVYGAFLIRFPAPVPAAVSLQPAEVMILPPGDPRQELASVGSPELAAAQARDGLESASLAEASELPPDEELAPADLQSSSAFEAIDAVEPTDSAHPITHADPPIEVAETALSIPPRELAPADPTERLPLAPAPVKRDDVQTKEIKQEARRNPAQQRSAPTPARRGQAGAGGGQRNASAQSIAAYASHVRSVLVSRTQRIRNLRATGRVGLTFTINASGRFASLSLSSSGHAEIDHAVRVAVRDATFPPPPDGRFSGSITITVR